MDDRVSANKIILGVAGYARDWITEEEGKRVDDITYAVAIDKAKLSNSSIIFDNTTYNLHYSYNERQGLIMPTVGIIIVFENYGKDITEIEVIVN